MTVSPERIEEAWEKHERAVRSYLRLRSKTEAAYAPWMNAVRGLDGLAAALREAQAENADLRERLEHHEARQSFRRFRDASLSVSPPADERPIPPPPPPDYSDGSAAREIEAYRDRYADEAKR